MLGVPQHKGIGLITVVKGLQRYDRSRELLPPNLRHYLDEPVVASAWYPEADLRGLLDVLAVVMAKDHIENVWEYFGRATAQRDLMGDEKLLPETARRQLDSGVYRSFLSAEVTEVATLFSRLSRLWGLYHDTGKLVVGRHHTREFSIVLRVLDFAFGSARELESTTAYFLEYARLAGVMMSGRLTRAALDDHDFTEWEFDLEPSADTAHSIERLAPL